MWKENTQSDTDFQRTNSSINTSRGMRAFGMILYIGKKKNVKMK
jgi:hypothetical protein